MLTLNWHLTIIVTLQKKSQTPLEGTSNIKNWKIWLNELLKDFKLDVSVDKITKNEILPLLKFWSIPKKRFMIE
jgi:hypothetical protein